MLPVRNASVRTLGGFTIRFVLDQGFVGRANERALVGRLVSGVADGVGGVLLVVGEQGIGKSALLREALAGAGRLGCGVGWGVADELQQGFPLGVMVECLGAEGRRAVAGGGEDGVGVTGGGWGHLSGPVLAGDPVLAGAERSLAVVDRLCAVSPMVVVVEDLQWADEASLMVWRKAQVEEQRAGGELYRADQRKDEEIGETRRHTPRERHRARPIGRDRKSVV